MKFSASRFAGYALSKFNSVDFCEKKKKEAELLLVGAEEREKEKCPSFFLDSSGSYEEKNFHTCFNNSPHFILSSQCHLRPREERRLIAIFLSPHSFKLAIFEN